MCQSKNCYGLTLKNPHPRNPAVNGRELVSPHELLVERQPGDDEAERRAVVAKRGRIAFTKTGVHDLELNGTTVTIKLDVENTHGKQPNEES